MSTIHTPERPIPAVPGPAPRVLIIQAAYYAAVIAGMRAGADAVLAEAGAAAEVVDVAGAFELPATLRLAVNTGRWDGYLVLGCVVRGETDHYEHICREACRGVMDVTVQTGAPVGFGLLTVHTLQQATERAANDRHNKGAEAAAALLTQLSVARTWGVPAVAGDDMA